MSEVNIVERIKKLLARSRSDNIHEAATAAEMAHKMMLEHKLSVEDVEGKESGITEEKLEGEKFMDVWRWGLLTACAWSYYTHTVRIEETMGDGKKKIAAHIVGKKDDIKTVIYLFSYFETEIERLSEDLIKKRELHGMTSFESYKRGAVVAIQEKLLAQRNKFQASNEKALVLSKKSEAEIKDYVKKEYPESYRPKMWGDTDVVAFERGFSAGRDLSTSREDRKRISRVAEGATVKPDVPIEVRQDPPAAGIKKTVPGIGESWSNKPSQGLSPGRND